MQVKEPKRKRNCKLPIPPPLPVDDLSKKSSKIVSHFNGFSVVVSDLEHMKLLNRMGFFGKGNLSKSVPTFNGEPQIIRKRQFLNRKAKAAISQRPSKVIVIPDSDSDCEDYFENLTPEFQIDKSSISEKLFLSLEEAYFLLDALKCLELMYNNNKLTEDDSWKLFLETDPYFAQNYVVYNYFRARQWVVKPGLKFGGDFLLYKQGPAFYHASYVVIIDILDPESLERREDLCRRNMDMTHIVGLNRLCENCGKELLICQLMWPKNCLPENKGNVLREVHVNEVLMRRWLPTKERDSMENT